MLEKKARKYYVSFKNNGGQIGKHYLKLTQMLVPLRVACAGGKVPLDDGSHTDGSGDDDEPQTRKKKVQKFSDFVFQSKLQALIKELESVRTKDKTGEILSCRKLLSVPYRPFLSSHFFLSFTVQLKVSCSHSTRRR